jgi:N-acetylmuramoyl-L-alanine amidase
LLSGKYKRARKRLTRYGILVANLVLLGAVLAFVTQSSGVGQTVNTTDSLLSIGKNNNVNPLDQLSSADIAANVARMADMPEAVMASNQADSVKVLLATAPIEQTIAAKPQIINSGLKSISDLKRYQTVPGDTISSIASKFGITSDSIKWSNSLTGDQITPGVWLWIPPVNGIVYVVQAGDTPEKLASKYGVAKEAIIAFNDAEISGLTVGRRIVIPGGRKVTAAAVPASGILFFGAGGYDPGWCTYYAAAKGGVPGGWGNANTWHIYGALSGWTVSAVPRVGAVAQTTAGWAGHVGIVEAVQQNADGSYMIKYSDMNGLAGFNRVGYSDWVPAIGKYQRFIYR